MRQQVPNQRRQPPSAPQRGRRSSASRQRDRGGRTFTLIDTPGHTDFAPEMERCLQVLDYAVLVISAAEGIQPHTETIWELLKEYNIPTLLFLNKADRPGAEKSVSLRELRRKLSPDCLWMEKDAEFLSPETVEELAAAVLKNQISDRAGETAARNSQT